MKKFLFLILSFITSMGFSAQPSFFSEFLYWQASQQTSSPWASVITISDTLALKDFVATNVDFKRQPGFRGGVGYRLPDFMDMRFYWTYFASDASETLSASPGHLILPEFFNGFTSGNFFFAAQLQWRLKMNMFDLELGHTLQALQGLNFRPYIGVKGGTINQSIHSSWNAFLYTSTENLKNNFYGIGPKAGIDSEWAIYKDLYIVGDFFAAFLWGRWNVEDVYSRPAAFSIISPTTIRSNTNHSMLGTYMFKSFLGLQWTHQGSATVTLKAGYEMQLWANQLRLPTFQQLPLHGDLTLQGGTCGIFVDF